MKENVSRTGRNLRCNRLLGRARLLLAALERVGGGQGGTFAPDQQAAEHHHAQQQAEEEPDQLGGQAGELAGVQRAHGLGDDFNRLAIAQQAAGFHLAGIGVDLGFLVHQWIPAHAADAQMGIGVAGEADVVDGETRNFALGDPDGLVRADHRRRAAVGGVDVDPQRAAVRVGDIRQHGEVRLAQGHQAGHGDAGLVALHGHQQLVIGQPPGVIRRRIGAGFRVGQPDDLLADHRQGAGDADDEHEEPDGQRQPAVHEEPDFRA
ncbi:hypothetical protein WR25_05945 [Diploscapter pachys]|uniref:Uncharacterized protein n=1 Tax=Diploscapter pachys TaxID=2018661 RepID=A0A2A2KEY9_9BILA|nr:hypothetical protein WR25_05945 [Diploscapter pachys]